MIYMGSFIDTYQKRAIAPYEKQLLPPTIRGGDLGA